MTMQAPIVRPSIILTPSTPTPSSAFSPAVLYNNEKSQHSEKTSTGRRFTNEELLGPPIDDLIAAEREREARADNANRRRRINLWTAFFALFVSAVIFTTYLHPDFAAGLSRLPSGERDVSRMNGLASASDANSIYFLDEGVAVPLMREIADQVFTSDSILGKRSSVPAAPDDAHLVTPLPLLRFSHSSATFSRHEIPQARSHAKRSLTDETESVIAERAQAIHAREMEEEMDLQRRVKVQETKRVQEDLMREAKGRLLRRRESRLAERMAGNA